VITLASASASRAALLEGAGVPFEAVSPGVDEETAKAALRAEGTAPRDLADALAELKAVKVSHRRAGLVLGGDQVCELDGEAIDKATSLQDARAKLMRLRGRTHRLHAASVLAQGGAVIWREVRTAAMTMRPFSDAFLDAYLEREREAALGAAGGYHYEGFGVQLFARVEGDDATIRGLPLLGLLDVLRRHGELAT
jgi:septum formation protein